MHDFSPYPALIGGAIIGLAAALFLLISGRVCGVSGLVGNLLRRPSNQLSSSIAFIGGLLVGGIVLRVIRPSVFASDGSPSLLLAALAGLLVGVGTQLGNGCTSGHGVCGVSRLSIRSIVATGTFMLTGFATVFMVRHVLGGAR